MEELDHTVMRCLTCSAVMIERGFDSYRRPSHGASSRGFHEFPTTVRGSQS